MSTKKYFNIEFSKCIGKGGSKKCYNITKLEPVSKRDVYNVTQIGLSIEDSEKIITELENGKPLVILKLTGAFSKTSIKEEVEIQKLFSRYNLSPYITDKFSYRGDECFLAVNCGKPLYSWGVDKLFDEDYDIEHQGFSLINRLINLFSQIYDLGYIFADSKSENICYDEQSGTFLLIDFGTFHCYKHKSLISKAEVIKYNLWILLFSWIIRSTLSRPTIIKYITEINNISDSNLGIDSRGLNLGLQMDRKIGKIGDGGILDEINRQLELFPGISKQALAKNFMYYSNSQNIDKYYYLTLNELLLLKYDEYISELGSSKKKGKKDEKEKKEKSKKRKKKKEKIQHKTKYKKNTVN